jgi:hypothetical protein
LHLDSDRKGILVAGLCFLHCIAGPALLAFAGFSSAIGFSEKIEPVFLVSSIVFGAAALVPAYRKRHGRLSCLVLFACGIACLLLRRQFVFRVGAEAIANGIGATLIVSAHALNVRFSKRCPCCSRGAGEEDEKIGLCG